MLKQPHVLIVEDEKKLADLLVDYFTMADFHSSCLYDGLAVEPWLLDHQPDVILLDLMLPGKDGMAICAAIRETSQVPILILTARVEEVDRLLGLDSGADDYICKPFSPKEVVARVKAVLRRTQPQGQSPLPFVLDGDRLLMVVQEQTIVLTAVEFKMLFLLTSEPGRIFSRDHLMNACYNDHRIVSDRTIDSHIKKLRKKIASVGNENWIQSVYGVGYKLEIFD
jgi:two-component system response regulator BaeR